MLYAVTLVLVGAALVLYLVAHNRLGAPFTEPGHTCPTCEIPLVRLTQGPSTEPGDVRSYDVLACPTCTNTLTLVHGTRSRFAYCPACQQRTLETPCIRLAPEPDDPLPPGTLCIEVRERCHLCEHAEDTLICIETDLTIEEEDPPRQGQVIPFPGAREVQK